MSSAITGIVKNGVVIPDTSLPENTQVEIHLSGKTVENSVAQTPPPRMTPTELRRLPREQRQAILAAAAELAEHDYRTDQNLTAFEAFSEEDFDDDDARSA